MAGAPESLRAGRKRQWTEPCVIHYDSDEVQIVPGIEPADIMGDGRRPDQVLRFLLTSDEYTIFQRIRQMQLL